MVYFLYQMNNLRKSFHIPNVKIFMPEEYIKMVLRYEPGSYKVEWKVARI